MIYDYYCVNCGNKFHGKDIMFDLSELLGVRAGDSHKGDPWAMVRAGVLRANAGKEGLKHEQISSIDFSLKTYLSIIGFNKGGATGREAMQHLAFDSREITGALNTIYAEGVNENREATESSIKEHWNKISKKFEFRAPEGGDTLEARRDTANYHAACHIKPIFFENGKSQDIYTVEYKEDAMRPNTRRLGYPTPIRGYCPTCKKPIVNNAGIYPHILVGFLGTQSAGKTTLIQALLQEISTSYDKCDIMFAVDILNDDRYTDVHRDLHLYRCGWPPMKTNTQGANSYNASLVLESSVTHNKKIVSFVDIAGEKCYNPDTDSVDMEAMMQFPLINSCDVYVLCSCIDKTKYGNGTDTLPPHAILNIARGIYGNLRDAHRIPPLCIAMTKSDTAVNAVSEAVSSSLFENNAIHPTNRYEYSTQLDNLKRAYEGTDRKEIREPIEWACKTFSQMKDITYMSMLAVSALGREADNYSGDPEHVEKTDAFEPRGVDKLLHWILQTIGLTAVEPKADKKFYFPDVPSYHQTFHKGAGFWFSENNLEQRQLTIETIFMNPSKQDAQLRTELAQAKNETVGTLRKRQKYESVAAAAASVLEANDLYAGEE